MICGPACRIYDAVTSEKMRINHTTIWISLLLLISSDMGESLSVLRTSLLGESVRFPVKCWRRSCKPTTLAMKAHLVPRDLFARALVATGIALILPIKPTIAAIPSLSDYNVGSGTVIKKTENSAPPEKLSFTAPVDSQSTLKALEETKTMLSKFEVSVTQNETSLLF